MHIYITQINRYIKKKELFDKKKCFDDTFHIHFAFIHTYKYILYFTLKKRKKRSFLYIHKNIACSNINENDR